jgi:putative transposase
MRFKFISTHRRTWPVRVMCRVLEVTPAGFYASLKRPVSERKKKQQKQKAKMKQIFEESDRSYGSPRMHEQLLLDGEPISRNTVAKLMKEAGICVIPKKKFVPQTTISDPSASFANVMDRDFVAKKPNEKWVCDITYIPTREGWLYLAVMIDLFSRRVVGWSMNNHLRSELASDALAMAITQRRPEKGLLHHSDRGVQYTSESYQRLVNECRIEVSMSGVGQCWDNAVAESFFSTLKREHVNGRDFATQQEARLSIFKWIEGWYNRKRLHSTLGYQSPEQFEATLN